MVLYDIKEKMGKKAGRFAKEGSLVVHGLPQGYLSVDDSDRKVACKKLKDILAIHCSHASTDDAYKKGLYPIEGLETLRDAMEKRSEAVAIFLHDFELQCEY